MSFSCCPWLPAAIIHSFIHSRSFPQRYSSVALCVLLLSLSFVFVLHLIYLLTTSQPYIVWYDPTVEQAIINMVFSKSASVALAMLGASAVNAHLEMVQPVPYSADSLNNSPLKADGSDFPCKLRPNAFQPPDQPNNMKIGESQPLQLMGSATHGGGSCQVSLTTDLEPSKDSQWMVIKSIEGGCPVNVEGNLSGGASAPVPGSHNFTIPDGIEPGKYTLAWTWFNRIGNREMYMNCAPINVIGGSSKRSESEESTAISKRSDFPAMFVANVNGCTTTEGYDLRFPNPGDNVVFEGNPENLLPKGMPACKGEASSWGVGGGSPSTPTATADPTGGISIGVTIGSDPTPTPQTSQGGPGVFAPVSSSQAPEPTSEPSAPSETSTPPSEPSTPAGSDSGSSGSGSDSGSGSSSSSGSSGSTGSAGVHTGSCDSEGMWNCIRGSKFQRCASGRWTPPQQMASGTQCNPGETAELKISATNNKRANQEMRRRRAHGHVHA